VPARHLRNNFTTGVTTSRRGRPPYVRRRPVPNPRLSNVPEELRDPSNFPQELREARNWIVWRDELVDGEIVRSIYNPVTGEPASLDDPSTWGTYDEVVAAYERSWGGGL
jgi:hypothetical protein